MDSTRKPEFAVDTDRIAREAEARFWLNSTVTDYLDDTLAVRPSEEYLVAYRADQTNPVSLSYSELSQRVSVIAVNLSGSGSGTGTSCHSRFRIGGNSSRFISPVSGSAPSATR